MFAARRLPVALRADASRLAAGSPDRDLVLWDTSALNVPDRTSRIRHGGGIVAAAWNPAAVALLATISADGSVATWRILDDRPPQTIVAMPILRDRPYHLAWLSGGKHLVSTTMSGRSRVWDADGRQLAVRGRTIGGLVLATHAWDGAVVVVSHLGHVDVWDPATQLTGTHFLPGRVVATAHSRALLAVSYQDGRIALLDRDLVRIGVIEPGAPAVSLALSEDSGALVVATADGSIAALDASRTVLWRRRVARTAPAGLAVASGLVAVISDEGGVTLLTLERGSPI
ncbi:hypothetical protein [Actinoplanes sp. NBRC 103695]|uniref:WD40 repeat domain-containing protein n=1 Tax=Actinoplanes sp. NBRC 103695 TaxID=3032202 RepID=UPI0024A0D564|nr:hypothetical protein [Actinoplanes sp. NBRC 103695]GLY99643.1 hypothetical protein Acsp02_68960 [Actinoplanes sp. NBRC 103695]